MNCLAVSDPSGVGALQKLKHFIPHAAEHIHLAYEWEHGRRVWQKAEQLHLGLLPPSNQVSQQMSSKNSKMAVASLPSSYSPTRISFVAQITRYMQEREFLKT